MRSSEPGLKRGFNIFLMLLAVFVATVMWYVVSVRDQLETQIEVNIDYIGIPQNLVVTSGLVSKLVVRLRGPETLIRSIPRHALSEVIDLSSIKKGDTVVPLGGEELGRSFRAFEIIDIQPPRIVVKADTLAERSVPLRTIVDSPLGQSAVTVENVTTSPATVILRGPESIISGYTYLPVTVRPDVAASRKNNDVTVALDTPSLVTAIPPSVRVSYVITSGREVLSRVCRVRVAGDNEHHYQVSPSELSLLIEVPEALAKNSSYLRQLEAIVAPPAIELNQTVRVPVRIRAPEGMTVINTQAASEVSVTKIEN